MARVIAVVPAQRSTTSMGIPFEPGCKAVSEPNQNGEHDRNHGWTPLADADARQRVEEEERRTPANQHPKRKKHCGRDKEGLRDRWEDMERR